MKIEVTNNYCKIVDDLTLDQLSVIQDICSFKVENSEFKQEAFKNRRKGKFEWDGYRKLFNIQTKKFPIGLLSLVMDTLNKYGVLVEIINKRQYTNEIKVPLFYSNEPRKYQDDAIITSIGCGNGIVKVATGGGKTFIAARTMYALCRKTIFIVHTRDLLYQAKYTFEEMFSCLHVGQIGDGIVEFDKDITVATMQTLAILGSLKLESYKYDEDKGEDEKKVIATKKMIEDFHKFRIGIGCVMMDEVQIVCSQTAFDVRFLFERANYAFGYSASPWRDDGSDLMIEAAFGRRIVDIGASELIRAGYLVRPIITVIKNNTGVYSGKTYPEVYKSAIVENTLRNLIIVNRALMHYNLGRNTLILVTLLKHGDILEDMIRSTGINAQFISGKSSMKKRKQAIDDMRNGRIQLLIASTIADVGLDIPRLQSIVEAGAGKSSVTALQRVGRIMRPFIGKNECYFDTFDDNVPMICNHILKKKEIWSQEEEFIIVEQEQG